jgi:hypothetical protein
LEFGASNLEFTSGSRVAGWLDLLRRFGICLEFGAWNLEFTSGSRVAGWLDLLKVWYLILGIWYFFGVCFLEFGAYPGSWAAG